jgi:hypothetical protein
MINLPAGYTVCDEPNIFYNPFGSNSKFRYYIVISSEIPYERIPVYEDGVYMKSVPFYLHSDGVWRLSTLFENQYTGYYETYEDAELALKSAISNTEV